jgi:hypothetical protein
MHRVLDGLLLAWVVCFGPFCWILRDGLGPGSIDSHGMQAVFRFAMTFYWGPILVGLLLLRLAIHRRSAGKLSE